MLCDSSTSTLRTLLYEYHSQINVHDQQGIPSCMSHQAIVATCEWNRRQEPETGTLKLINPDLKHGVARSCIFNLNVTWVLCEFKPPADSGTPISLVVVQKM